MTTIIHGSDQVLLDTSHAFEVQSSVVYNICDVWSTTDVSATDKHLWNIMFRMDNDYRRNQWIATSEAFDVSDMVYVNDDIDNSGRKTWSFFTLHVCVNDTNRSFLRIYRIYRHLNSRPMLDATIYMSTWHVYKIQTLANSQQNQIINHKWNRAILDACELYMLLENMTPNGT